MNNGACCADPKSDATSFAKIKEYNYLAHSIREMEHEIHRRKRITYHVAIKMVDTVDYASITSFYRCGCIIFLQNECEGISRKDIRLVLAHELGHISYNIERIDQMSGLNVSPPDDEEWYAWSFAYYLLDTKSNSYKDGVGIDEYIYRDDELYKLLMHNVIRLQPEQDDLQNRIKQSISDRNGTL
jgi:hypothetical protein